MTKAIMIQGTGSGVGKSLIVAGLCRIFSDMGIRVSPFKSQNMALNSFITREGGEIGRAQAFQAEAARLEPLTDMNPVLLKATGDSGCQVILNGKVHSEMRAQEYYSFKDEAWAAVTKAYERLSRNFDLIVIEGAGSPAEINLMEDEIVNMRMARHAEAPVILVGDIDKGGVFASFYGTLALIGPDAERIRAFLINKFRGDREILRPALDMITGKTDRPVIGVVPYRGDLALHEEDGIPLERIGNRGFSGRKIKIVVVRLRYISNFTDFDPFLYEPDVEVLYSWWEGDVENADLIIIPGSKNTVNDLLFMRENGIEESIRKAARKGIPVIGICGGYQMLGKRILDPHGIEGNMKEVEGIGLLDTETVFDRTKITAQVEAVMTGTRDWPGFGGNSNPQSRPSASLLRGYEIHMGRTTGDVGLFKINRLTGSNSSNGLKGSNGLNSVVSDGSVKGKVWGTYIHGIFDNDRFRREIINSLRIRRGFPGIDQVTDFGRLRDEALDRWAEILIQNIDLDFLLALAGRSRKAKGTCV